MAEVYPDDEGAARLFFDLEAPRRTWRTAQVCGQVERAASSVLAGECADAVLEGASVVSVEPAPDGGRLLVTVVLAPGHDLADLAAAWTALSAMKGTFRTEAASWIHRKRVPELAFRVLLGEAAP